MTRPRDSIRAHAFTLVECLAVVALLSLAVSVILAGVAQTADEARLRDARSLILDADARARCLALRGDTVILRLDGHRVLVTTALQSAPLLVRELPASVSASLLAPASPDPLTSLQISFDGRSRDYVISLQGESRRSDTLVSGLTGHAFDAHRGESR